MDLSEHALELADEAIEAAFEKNEGSASNAEITAAVFGALMASGEVVPPPQGAVDPMRWVRAFNSLEKAVTNVLDDDHPANLDYLARAHAATLREVGPNP